jgi:hypothetical protein
VGPPGRTQRLEKMGATLCKVDGVDRQLGFRFELDGQIIDVVAPDGLGKAATTAGKLETIQIPGGTQALARTEIVEIVVDGVSSRVRRPTLLGGVLLKARALPVHSGPEDQREDIITLRPSQTTHMRCARASRGPSGAGYGTSRFRSLSTTPRCQHGSRSRASEPLAPRSRSWSLENRPVRAGALAGRRPLSVH